MTLEQRLWLFAAVSLCLFSVLSYAVSHGPSSWRVDIEASVIRGQAVPLALVFTMSGRALPLFIIAVISVATAVLAQSNVLVAVAILATQLLSQATVEAIKRLYRRTRPDIWFVRRDLGFSYPSGHATTAIVFYGSWLIVVLTSLLSRDVKIVLCAILVIWIVGIDWSRIALGAHYPTDVAGGTLFGLACASALWATLLHFALWI